MANMEVSKGTFYTSITTGNASVAIFKVPYDSKKMVNEKQRLKTFKTWPKNNPMQPRMLAKAGFCYIGINDAVKCFVCGEVIEGWESGDVAIVEHERLSPKCEFVKNPNYKLVSPQNEQQKNEFAIIKVVHEPRMASEDQRLNTFQLWPAANLLKPRMLARAGFYCIGYNDVVMCFSCGGMIQEFKPGNTAMQQHTISFPKCDFVKDYKGSENIPLEGEDDTDGCTSLPVKHIHKPTNSVSYEPDTDNRIVVERVVNVSSSSPPASRPGSPTLFQSTSQPTSEYNRDETDWQGGASGQLRNYSGTLKKYSNSLYTQEEARLRTFNEKWHSAIGIFVTPHLLAEAGFFFTGPDDLVRCFYCGVGVNKWEPDDEPWSEHAKFQPDCAWLIHQRGQDFIAQVQMGTSSPLTTTKPDDTKMRAQGVAMQNSSTGSMDKESIKHLVRDVEKEQRRKHGRKFLSPEEFIDAFLESINSLGFGEDEAVSQHPHMLETSYQQRRHPQQPYEVHGAASQGKEPSKRDVTGEEGKAPACQHRKITELEAGVEVTFTKKPNAEAEKRMTSSQLKAGDSRMSAQSTDILQSLTAQTVLEMGFDEKLVCHVVADHLNRTGHEFSSSLELIEAVLIAQEKGTDPSSLDLNSERSSPSAGRVHDSNDDEGQHSAGKSAIQLLETGNKSVASNKNNTQDECTVQPPHVLQTSYQQIPVPHRQQPQDVHGACNHIEEHRESGMTSEQETTVHYHQTSVEPEFHGGEVDLKTKSNAEPENPIISSLSEPGDSRTNRLDDIQRIIDMGYEEKFVRYVVEEHLDKTGRHFSSAEELFDAVYAAQEEGIDPTSLGMTGGTSPPKDTITHASNNVKYPGTPADEPYVVKMQTKLFTELSIKGDSADDKLVIDTSETVGLRAPPNAAPLSPDPLSTTHTDIDIQGSQTDVESLERNLQSLRDTQLCVICLDREKNMLFLPCKHLSTCRECATKVNECPMCRKAIGDCFQVYNV